MVVGLGIYIALIYSVIQYDGVTYYWVGDVLPAIAVAVVVWNVLLLIVTILVIVDSVRKIRAGKTLVLATDVFVVKLVSIPFFVVNFAVMAALGLAGSLIFLFGGFLLLGIAATSIVFTYLAMLSTSIYGWASIVRLRRERTITTRLTVLYTILLALFMTDIAAGIMLFGHARRRPMTALLWVLIAFGALLAVAGLSPAALVDPADLPPGWMVVSIIGVAVILATVVFAIVRARRSAGAISVS